MPESVIIAVVSGALATAATLVAAYLTQRGNYRQSVIEHRSASYEALDARVGKLEAQVGLLRNELETTQDDLAVAVAYAQRLRQHIEQAAPPPPPAWPDGLEGVPI